MGHTLRTHTNTHTHTHKHCPLTYMGMWWGVHACRAEATHLCLQQNRTSFDVQSLPIRISNSLPVMILRASFFVQAFLPCRINPAPPPPECPYLRHAQPLAQRPKATQTKGSEPTPKGLLRTL